MSHITDILIEGLNGDFDLHIPFQGQHCIMVGPNGVGKSTALQIIAHALGRKFGLMAEHRFDSITITWGDTSAQLFQSDCALATRRHRNPSAVEHRLAAAGLLEDFLASDLSEHSEYLKFRFLSASRTLLTNVQSKLRDSGPTDDAAARLSQFSKLLSDTATPKCSFLPTSRRIEVELEKISSSLPDFLGEGLADYFESQSSSEYFEEIIRFGMEDVDAQIRQFERFAQAESRNKFNFLMASLLKEMANKKTISVRELREKDLSESEIRRVLSRIEEGVLSAQEKDRIINTVSSMREPQKGGGHPEFHKKWLSHFFVRLQDVDRELQTIERPMLKFVSTMKRYLPPKEVRYDIESSRFSVRSPKGDEIKLSEMSSGEKQLTAILAMLEFSSVSTNVLIDEPELSLSVPWQTSILEDITETLNCHQLIAVTHSPFVYDNGLTDSVLDFADCMVSRG